MSTIHPYRLRPYHNPEGIDESTVTRGWRLRYADEANEVAQGPCKDSFELNHQLVWFHSYSRGLRRGITFIVPVEA